MNLLTTPPVQETVTMWTVIITALGIFSSLALQVIKMMSDKQKREQDRLDWELTQQYRDNLEKKVDKGIETNLASVRASNLAVKTSNGIKKDLFEKGVKLINEDDTPPADH